MVSHNQTSRMMAAANEPYVTLKLLKLAMYAENAADAASHTPTPMEDDSEGWTP